MGVGLIIIIRNNVGKSKWEIRDAGDEIAVRGAVRAGTGAGGEIIPNKPISYHIVGTQ